MKKWLTGKNIVSLCISALLALEVLLMIDAVVVFRGGEISLTMAAGAEMVLTILIVLLFRRRGRQLLAAALAIPVVLAALALGAFACWKQFSLGAGYQEVDSGKDQIYGERRVMLIVPHQDDDLNILGGVLEEYARYGSALFPVFVTNGDYYGLTEIRYREAIQVFESIGVPEDHVIFLGYGDSWNADGPHIYNAQPGVVVQSHFGRTQTYGAENHAAYREGRDYTVDHLMEDLKSVILEYRPDVIFCSDYDHHIDHKSTTLLFEKVMGGILKEYPEYKPAVYKAYAYGTAWEAEPDFYAENILSTRNLFAQPYGQEPEIYRWEDRVRFPVKGAGLSRSLITAEGYQLLDMYASQEAGRMAVAVVNGDKVAWQRNTDTLCLRAQVAVSSGDGSLLNDFMLIDNHNLTDESHQPYDGVWIPEKQDIQKTARIILEQTSPVYSLTLYDHPSEEENVLNARITFDDGTMVETGPLDPRGAATVIRVDKEAVASFTVTLTELQGENAGLSEVEAFAQQPETEGRFIKLMDQDGNFLYDYRMDPEGTALLQLYTYGDLPALSADQYHVGVTGQSGTATLEDGVIRVTCPRGAEFVLNITCDAAGLSDSISVRNPGRIARAWTNLWQRVEEEVLIRYSRAELRKLLIYSVPAKISYVLRHL